jgi:hypothetical protein
MSNGSVQCLSVALALMLSCAPSQKMGPGADALVGLPPPAPDWGDLPPPVAADLPPPLLAPPEYELLTLEGWTVHVRRELLAGEKQATDAALALLDDQLKTVARLVSPGALEDARDDGGTGEGARP